MQIGNFCQLFDGIDETFFLQYLAEVALEHSPPRLDPGGCGLWGDPVLCDDGDAERGARQGSAQHLVRGQQPDHQRPVHTHVHPSASHVSVNEFYFLGPLEGE
jgi:hypothetical protein